MARSTVFRFKGKEDDPQKIGQTLQVERRADRAASPSAAMMLECRPTWSILPTAPNFGDRITNARPPTSRKCRATSRATSRSVCGAVDGETAATLGSAGTTNPEAYRLYLEGRQLWYGRTPEGLKKSIDLFQQAIAADPNYALAYTGLADTYNVIPSYGAGITSRQAGLLADDATRKALELDDSLPEAHHGARWLR